MDLPPFPGFRPEAFAFLINLKANNRRDWFKPRKATYDDELLWPLRCLVADASRRAQQEGLPLGGDPKKSLFRIYRDTRFSKNKTPYKTHVAAVLSRSGADKGNGGVYIHIEPENTFLAAGYWNPDSALLRAWRNRMAEDPAAFLSLVDTLAASALELKPHGDPLKRMPRGFEAHKDSPIADYLRWKSYLVVRNIDPSVTQAGSFTEEVIEMMQDVLPLLAYGWEIQDSVPA